MLRGRKTRGIYRLKMSRQEELLSVVVLVVLVVRMDKGSHRCTKVNEASARVRGGFRVV